MEHKEDGSASGNNGVGAMNDSGIGRRASIAFVVNAAFLPSLTWAEETADPWPELAAQIFPDRPMGDGTAVLAIDAPYRAEDAAVVPVTLRWALPDDDRREVRAVTLVIDANPSPLAARFVIGEGSVVDRIATRVRVDDYTNFHAVAELNDGSLLASRRYVKAAGGCSAPALKVSGDTIAPGTMRLREFAPDPASARPGWREAQIMIRHPNYSGMQMDQVTRLYVPAHFIQSLRVQQGGALLFAAEEGISIAENPLYRFAYRPNGAKEFRVEAEDSDGGAFQAVFPITAPEG
jgi:sulfur-oxidizing protein SoxY